MPTGAAEPTVADAKSAGSAAGSTTGPADADAEPTAFAEAESQPAVPQQADSAVAAPSLADAESAVPVTGPGAADSLRAAEPLGLAELGRLVAQAAAAAPSILAGASYVEAAKYAAGVEDLSRTVEYLQVLSAGTVDRTRTQAIAAADTARANRSRTGKGWVTGWDNGVETLNETDTNWPGPSTARDAGNDAATGTVGRGRDRVITSPADDGCANTGESLRLLLRIGKSEANRRLALAKDILPASTLTGDTIPAPRQHLAAALTPTPTSTSASTGAGTPNTEASTGPEDGTGTGDSTGSEEPAGTDNRVQGTAAACPAVSSRAGTIIALTLNRLQHLTTPAKLALIEENLTATAATSDPDFLARVARRWADTIDADGTEPSEEALRHTQGAFIRKPRHGLHHLEIFATTDQYEHLLTVMNTATNPRTTTTNTSSGSSGDQDGNTQDRIWNENNTGPDLDRRTRPQKQLEGLVGAAKIALATNTLPATGGNRPQIIATINYQDLFPHHTPTNTDPGTTTGTATGTGTGNLVFTGPVAAATLRKLACDADIIPALLGTHGELLDLGRKTRLFTPAQRTALTARDQGCAFPNCTIPAPWCEAHHITYGSHHGTTNTNNGVLLCSGHHHLIHKEQWTITTPNNTPWFTPPKHLDPHQKPQQNTYFKPPPPPTPRE
ncbi:HNH endonuclease [Pseudarthrobacter siccitolerans]|uniref:HNH endonuclease n=1 Tax=Pseudarthrobacter siccitolerans TaxID=861266 RepID=A0A024GZA5_9MICC|nr:HNH endonuclease [Pseudarthrobacter siccitolerans]